MQLLHHDQLILMNPKKIRRIMHKYNLYCPIRQANPYRRLLRDMRTDRTADNLVNREFACHGLRKILLTDISYLRRKDGQFSYLSVIIDAFTRQALAYALSDSLAIDFVLLTVNCLIVDHGIALTTVTLIHSDQGCPYKSIAFGRIVQEYQLRQSMSRKANCWDNALQESFFGHMKDEIDITGCETHKDICAVVDDWMDYYNNDRYQWSLAKLSPNEFYDYIRTGRYPLGALPQTPEFTDLVSGKGNEKDEL